MLTDSQMVEKAARVYLATQNMIDQERAQERREAVLTPGVVRAARDILTRRYGRTRLTGWNAVLLAFKMGCTFFTFM